MCIRDRIDTEWKFLEDYPDITNCLKRMPSMETRSMSLFIKPGMKDQFRTAFEKHFGSCYTLLSKEEVLSLKLFGSGTPHKRSTNFIGDFIAVATKNIEIDCGQPQMTYLKPHTQA